MDKEVHLWIAVISIGSYLASLTLTLVRRRDDKKCLRTYVAPTSARSLRLLLRFTIFNIISVLLALIVKIESASDSIQKKIPRRLTGVSHYLEEGMGTSEHLFAFRAGRPLYNMDN
jgi:hypothetical protein